MADDNAKELIKRGNARFSKRAPLDRLRHEIALNFAPYLAEWTAPIIMGQDFASHLVDGTPLLMAREFQNQVGAMLRPAGKQWFWHRHWDDDINNDRECRDYLDWRSQQQMRIMTDRYTGFHRATKQTDEFFALFGDAVMSVDTNEDRSELRIASYHTKDCAWAIGPENKPDTITRKEQPACRVVKARFRQRIDKLDERLEQMIEKDGDQTIDLRHEVIPADEYEAYCKPQRRANRKDGWYSVWIDATHGTVIRETWQKTFKYVIPRWVTLTGNPYAISPATTIALPDARLIQQQALAILEAAEKQVNPPLLAHQDAIRGDVRLDGITWIDRSFADRSDSDALKVLELGKNFNLGVDSLLRTEAQLTRAFYLDRLRMPDTRNSKSTIEVQFMIDEYIRAALPLFAPMQIEYNDPMLAEIDAQIDLLGGYDMRPMPDKLKDRNFSFAWNNPLTDMLERQKAQMISEAAQIGQTIAALEAAATQSPSLQQLDTAKSFRETMMGIGVASWLHDEHTTKKNQEAGAEANQTREALAVAPNIADVVHRGAQAAQIASEIPQAAEPSFALPPPM